MSLLRCGIFSQRHKILRLDNLCNFIVLGSSEGCVSFSALVLHNFAFITSRHALLLVEIVGSHISGNVLRKSEEFLKIDTHRKIVKSILVVVEVTNRQLDA